MLTVLRIADLGRETGLCPKVGGPAYLDPGRAPTPSAGCLVRRWAVTQLQGGPGFCATERRTGVAALGLTVAPGLKRSLEVIPTTVQQKPPPPPPTFHLFGIILFAQQRFLFIFKRGSENEVITGGANRVAFFVFFLRYF